MARMPVSFKRVAAVFDELARARLCESSGSEHSQESLTDLSDLVNSFLERDNCVEIREEIDEEKVRNKYESEGNCSDSEMKEELKSLLGYEDDDDVKREIHAEAEEAWRVVGGRLSPDFNRRLMARLRERGFDAGLCKSKWEKTGRYPSGNYEFIDVNVAGTRYIVEVFLAGEFKIARPTDHYTSLLNIFPLVFVGKIDELKQVVRLMCNAIKNSMKTMDMYVPPWRRHGYLQARWFGSYKRTIKEIPARKGSDCSDGDLAGKRLVGFVAVPPISYYCREDFASKVGLTVGNLAMVLNGSSIL